MKKSKSKKVKLKVKKIDKCLKTSKNIENMSGKNTHIQKKSKKSRNNKSKNINIIIKQLEHVKTKMSNTR